jgi:uncharacterized damage-inducible protein DinB
MPRIVDSILMELDQEAATTRRVLERVPGDKLGWKPHEKSMSLGQLALHVATAPGDVAGMTTMDEVDVPDFGEPPTVSSAEELMAAYDKSVSAAREILDGMDDAKAMATWKATKGGEELMAVPRIGVVRSILLNHWYHHRGQLSVYLRLLNVPVPSIYGPSADENPWA